MTTTSRLTQPMKIAIRPLIATAIAAAAIAFPATAYADTPAAPGVEAPPSAIPWSGVGPGWVLATWSPISGRRPGEAAPPGEPAPETATTRLYLVDPAGGRYPVTTFPPGNGSQRRLIDWSGDGTRALFQTGPYGSPKVLTEVDLHTGAQTTLTVKGSFESARYTRPEGKAILLETPGNAAQETLERVDLAGTHQLTYPVAKDFRGYLSTPDGTQLVVGTDSGLALMGNDGVPGKSLPIAAQKDCAPTRWWDADATVVLARCADSPASQLWLVPVDGATPTPLTALNNGQKGPDYGDANAWQLPAGTYVQALGACGVIYLAKLNADGTTSVVSVPNVGGQTVVVVGVNGGDLDLQAKAGCGGGQSLVDYKPSAGTSTVLLGPPVNGGGVIDAVPFSGQR